MISEQLTNTLISISLSVVSCNAYYSIFLSAKTLRSIIDEHMSVFYKTELSKSLIRPFSLYVLDGALEAISEMHSRGWVHKDLHRKLFITIYILFPLVDDSL